MSGDSSEATNAQRLLVGAVRRGTPFERLDDDFARAFVAGNERLSPAEQLEIYREQFWLRHEEALREDFPAVARALGDARFALLVEEALDEPALASFSLAELGRALPRALARPEVATKLELSATERTRLRELAELEWSFCEVFHEAESPLLDTRRLETLSPEEWESATLELRAALRLHRFDSEIPEWRRQLKETVETTTPKERPCWVVVYRSEDLVLFDKSVPEPAFALLEALKRGASLLDACEAVASRSDASRAALEAHLLGWFSEFTQLGFFARVRRAEISDE